MATLQELENALVNADRAGDMDAARKLAAAITVARQDKANLIPDVQIPGTVPQAPEPSIAEQIVGAGEAALTTATGATGGTLGMIGGTLKGLAEQILSGKFGTQEALRMVERSAAEGAQELTYAPRTQAGQAQAQAVGEVAQELIPVAPLTAEMGAIAAGTRAAVPSVSAAVRRAIPVQTAKPTAKPQPVPGIKPITEPIPATTAFGEIGDLVRKASGSGPGSSSAKSKLADVAQINPEARAAAERLGLDLPFDVFSDNPQIRAAVGLTRSVAGGEAEAAWVNTVRESVTKADDVMQKFDAAFVEGRPAPGVTSQRILDSLKTTQSQLDTDASAIYQRVDGMVPKQSQVRLAKTSQTLDDIVSEVGQEGLSAQERKLAKMIEDGDVTYGRLLREKSLIGQAMAGKESPYGNLDAASLKRMYAALAEDQLENVGAIGGDALRKELRAANLLTAKKKALEKRIVNAFGREIDGSVATLMQSAIKSASRGDAAQFSKIMKVVPQELRKETIATALASVSSSARAGQAGAFGFAEFAKTYRGLRANPPVYKQIVDALGKDADPVMRDLYEISRRITDARAQVLTTGKANQALVEAMKSEGLVGKVMRSTMAQRAATGAASVMPGGGFVAPDIVKFMTSGNADAVKAAGKLFASEEFQKLAIEAAIKPEVSNSSVRAVAASAAFAKFMRRARIPATGLGERMTWIQNAVIPDGAVAGEIVSRAAVPISQIEGKD